jgi:hypothetical protein
MQRGLVVKVIWAAKEEVQSPFRGDSIFEGPLFAVLRSFTARSMPPLNSARNRLKQTEGFRGEDGTYEDSKQPPIGHVGESATEDQGLGLMT